MMKLKLTHDRKIVCSEFVSPEMIIGNFNNELTETAIKDIIDIYNFGLDMLFMCKTRIHNLDISTVADTMQKITSIYKDLDYKLYEHRKKGAR